MYPPPRASRLHKAALTFLVAAAALFVGEPGNAALKPRTIKISQMTVSTTDMFEGDSHTATASLVAKPGLNVRNLDNRAVRVEWTVEADGDNDPEHEWTDNNPSSSSNFDFTYDGLGSTTGSAVVVKAVAFDALGDSDTAQTTINVWTKSETVNIVSKTSDNTYIGSTTDDVFVQTDVGFYRVNWVVDDGSGGGATAITHNGPGLTSQITYDFSTVPHGNTVTFTATPYGVNANGRAVAGDAASIKIVAWKKISVENASPSLPKVVEAQEFFVDAFTNIPFSRVEYSVELGDTHRDNSGGANDTESQISHTFYNLPENGLVAGYERDIVVTAYATINGKEFKSDPFTVEVTVYNDNGFIWKSVELSIDSFEQVDGHRYAQATTHSLVYYNDAANRPLVNVLRQNGWWMGDFPNPANMMLFKGASLENSIRAKIAYSATFSSTLTSSFDMVRNKFHGGHALMRFGKLGDPNQRTHIYDEIADERYQGNGIGLPPTGGSATQNPSRKARLLAD